MSPEAALAAAGFGDVSRETIDRLQRFVDLFDRWQRTHNLMSREESADIWMRHVADSAQLVAIAPQACRWLDIGSGGGFPGIVTACLIAHRPGTSVDLIESNSRKVAFLREARRATGAPITVHADRIEDILPTLGPYDAISARALASLDQLCEWVQPAVARGAIAYFHKGRDFERERVDASHRWTLDLVEHPSRISAGVIAEIRSIEPRM